MTRLRISLMNQVAMIFAALLLTIGLSPAGLAQTTTGWGTHPAASAAPASTQTGATSAWGGASNAANVHNSQTAIGTNTGVVAKTTDASGKGKASATGSPLSKYGIGGNSNAAATAQYGIGKHSNGAATSQYGVGKNSNAAGLSQYGVGNNKGSVGGIGAGYNGAGYAGPHLDNGGMAGVSDDKNERGKYFRGSDKSSNSPSAGDWITHPIDSWKKTHPDGNSSAPDAGAPKGHTIKVFKNKDSGDMGFTGSDGGSDSNGKTINTGNKGGGDAGSGQTGQAGSTSGGANAMGHSFNGGAYAGGDAQLKKPSANGVLNGNAIKNGASDPRRGGSAGGN